jgi:hypothetical protein
MRNRREKSIALPLLSLYKENIKEIDSLFSTQTGQGYEIQLGDHVLDSIEEMETLDDDEPIHELRFASNGPIVLSLTVNTRTSEIAYYEDSISSFGIAKKLEEVVLKAQKGPVGNIAYKVVCIFFVGIAILSSLNLFLTMFLNLNIIAFDSATSLSFILMSVLCFLIVVYMQNYVNVNTISIKSKKSKKGFFKKNKQVVIIVISNLITFLATSLLALLIERLLRNS